MASVFGNICTRLVQLGRVIAYRGLISEQPLQASEGFMQNNIKQILMHFAQDESGQDLIEYALVAALVAMGAVAAMNGLGTKVSAALTTVGTKLTTSV